MNEEKPQLHKFKEAARELECDDDEKRFKDRLGKLAKRQLGKTQPSGAD
jgi:hypothetical protein